MKKTLLFVASALVSMAMMAGPNDLLWDYTEAAPSSNPDNGLTYGSKVDDGPGNGNGLKGVKMDGSGYAYFTKAAVAGKLKLTFGPRSGSNEESMSVYTWTGDAPKAETLIATTGKQAELGTQIVDLSAEHTNIYIKRTGSVQSVLQKIQFVESVARTFTDFKIEFRVNPYVVLLPESGILPTGVSVEGTTYNGGQHGIQGGTITVPVDGPVKFTFGACQYSTTPINIKKNGADFTTFSNNAACGETEGNFAQNVMYVYTGDAATLTFELGSQTYVPYFFAEATDITPCEVIYKDQNGTKLGSFETYEGATLATIPYDVNDLPAVGEGNAFRGWFYANGKKAQEGDAITGNTTIQAKVTPIEVATIGSVQTYDFASAIFYPEDHETVTANDGSYYNDHGWYFNVDGSIDIQVAGNAIVNVTLCTYSETGDVILKNGETEIGRTSVIKNGSEGATPDGTEYSYKYTGEATTLTLSWTAKQYIHKIVVYNVQDFLEKDEATGYFMVPAGDVACFLLALVQAESGDKIFLPNGTYDLGETCLTTISKDNISIIGQSMEGVIIKNAPDASKESIDKTATLKINKNVKNTYLQDLTIQNALDYYKNNNGRAVCLWDQGSKTICKNVRLLSYQDTYYSNLSGAVKYFEDCEIHGTVDFICGDGSVYFKNNLLYAEKRNSNGGGSDALTANNGPATDKGYVFESCTVKSECPVVSFGRAWNGKPSVAFLNTLVDYSAGQFDFSDGSKIQRWTKELMNDKCWPAFGEYNTHLADGTVLTPASNVVTFNNNPKYGTETQSIETVLTAEEAATYTMEYTLGEWAATARTDASQLRKNVMFDEQTRTLSWNPTEVGVYMVCVSGVPFITTETSFVLPDVDEVIAAFHAMYGDELEPIGGYYVRFANGRGGFGPIVYAGDNPENIENTSVDGAKAVKVIRDGQVIIVRGEKEYSIFGQEVK